MHLGLGNTSVLYPGVLGLTPDILACVQVAPYSLHLFLFFSQSHLGALSAVSILVSMALLLLWPRCCDAEGMACKPPTAHLHWHTFGPPPILTALLHQLLIFSPLPLLQSSLPKAQLALEGSYYLSNGFENLIVSPAIVIFHQCLGTATQDVPKGACPWTKWAGCFFFNLAPRKQVG